MKGIIIYGDPMWGDNERATYCEFMNEASFDLKTISKDQIGQCGHYIWKVGERKKIVSRLEGEASEKSKAVCSKDDTYDFETGALIALMKMCGLEKVVRACNEAFPKERYNTYIAKLEGKLRDLKKDSDKVIDELIEENDKLKIDKDKSWKNYQRKIQKKQDRINQLEAQIKASEDDKLKNIEYYEKEIKNLNYRLTCKDISLEAKDKKISIYEKRFLALEAENEKLKLDCEKLQHGYNDMIFCGGRQNGKQYKTLVEMFKKLDQKKVDAAYKEAYNTELPIWQKEFFKQMCDIHKESKEKIELPRTLDINGTTYRKSIQIRDFGEQINKLTVDSLIEQSRVFTRKCVDEWIKPPTKREEMWGEILELHKTNDVIIEVKKEDVTTFLHEIENRIPEITWGSGVKIFETKYTIKDVYFELKSHDVIYFRLSRATKLTYTSDPHIYPYRELKIIDYLPPMRWDLFKKGQLAVKVDYDNYKEFYEACEKELGRRPVTAVFTEDFTVSICKKDGLFEIFTIEDQKKTGRKIVDWEDVRENKTTMEDPYDTWKW